MSQRCEVRDEDKTKQDLINEIMTLQQRVTELEASETEHMEVEQSLRENEEHYRAVVQNVADAIVINVGTTRVFVNQAFLDLHGLEDVSQVSGVPLDHFIAPDDRLLVAERTLARQHGEPVPGIYEYRILRADGQERTVETSAVSIIYKGQPAALAVLRDITERKHMEEALEETRDAALGASRAKSEFVSHMSHEIRTPMNAIIGMGDLLAESPLSPEQQEYVRISRKAGEQLLALINDIFDLSKVEARQVNLESIDFELDELVENTVEVFSLRAQESGLELNCHISPDVPMALVGDPHHVRQILTNLLSNAIRFTHEGEVVLHVENDPEASGPGRLLFRVADTGIGIPQEKLDSIFDSFTQVDSSITRKYGGTGLGLAISQRLAELMGGRIWVDSEVGKGTTFYFAAQFGIQAGPHERPLPSWEDIKGLKTLITDDNATNRMILREMLSAWGASPIDVPDGYQALAELERARREGTPYRLLLLDYNMEGMDGFQVAERIRVDMDIADLTIIVLTSGGNRDDDMARCEELGVSRYMVKPVKRSELLHAITTAMGFIKAPVGEHEPVPTSDAPPEEERELHILLVEDSYDNRVLIEWYLKKTPYTVEVAENGEIAVSKFTAGHYDIVLMDMQMPVKDGYTATREIREWETEQGLEPTPIIALTAYALNEDVHKSLDAGCNGHITKPVKKAVLMAAIREQTEDAGRVPARIEVPSPG